MKLRLGIGAAFLALAGSAPFAQAGLMIIAHGGSVATEEEPPPEESSDDWSTRSTASGVQVADRLDTQAIIDDWKLSDAQVGNLSLDTSIKPATSAGGSLAFAILNTNTDSAGQLSVPFSPTLGAGGSRWWSYRVYFQPDELYAPWPLAAGQSDQSAKLSILSRDGNGASPIGSYQSNEVVVQLNYVSGLIDAYRGHDVQFDPFATTSFTTACAGGATDVRSQTSLDRGSNSLTGTDVDDGSAWSSCQQDRARYGSLYTSRNAGASTEPATNYKQGLGDPFSGARAVQAPGEWLTVTGYTSIGTFGSGTNDSRVAVMVAREDSPYTLLVDTMTEVGDASDNPAINALNLVPFATGRDSGGRHVSANDNNLAGCFTIWNVGPSTATGTATIAYNASTQRFTFAAAGDSAGSARGFSNTNNITAINLISSTTTNFINGKVTSSGCPGSNTTATITIATARNNTKRNYSDVIISSSPINAPGGYTPPISVGGGSSALAVAAAALSTGTWGTLVTNGLNQTLIKAGETGADSIMSFSPNSTAWDPLVHRGYFYGGTHGNDSKERIIRYVDATNTWETEENNTPEDPGNCSLGGGLCQPHHGYGHFDLDPLTGRKYARGTGGNAFFYRDYAEVGSWHSAAVLPGSLFGEYDVANAISWFPEFNSGAGAVVFSTGGSNIRTWNPATNTWTTRRTTGSSTYHTWSIYNHDDNKVYVGGSQTGDNTMWQLDSAGTVTQKADVPFSITTASAGGGNGTGKIFSGTTGKMWAVSNLVNLDIYEYTTGSNSWADTGINLPFNPYDDNFFCMPIDEYSVVMCAYLSGGETPSSTVYLWKH